MSELRWVSAFGRDITRLCEHGYSEVDGVPSEAGQFRVVGHDVAPGWAEYWFELEVYELPACPLADLGW